MDSVRIADLKAIDVGISANKEHNSYYAQDQRSGQIFEMPRRFALAFVRCKAMLFGQGTRPSDEDLKTAFGAMYVFDAAHKQKLGARTRFNPMFQTFEIVGFAQLQPYFARFASALFRPWAAVLSIAIVLLAVFLGAQNDWAIAGTFRNAFSLNAIATFALFAPILKLFHELGHILTAQRFGVPVRAAGIRLIGLYPMPYVDVSDADLLVGRRERILIASAGIAVDVLFALVAMILWHLSEGTFWQTLFGNIFVFGTVNSVLFNANPLIKLDGYFIVFDALGERNFGSAASTSLRNLWRKIYSFGLIGAWPKKRRDAGLIAYGIGSFLYKINIMVFIIWQLLPKFLGLGALIVAWGSYAMFVAPILADRAQVVEPSRAAKAEKKVANRRFWVFLGGLGAALLCVLLFVERSPRLLLPITPATERSYVLTTTTGGRVSEIATSGTVQAGAALLQVENPILTDRIELLGARRAQAAMGLASVQGSSEAQSQIGESQIEMLDAQLALAIEARAGLKQSALHDGLFVPKDGAYVGVYLREGEVYGSLYPSEGQASMIADMPEAWINRFRSGVARVEIRVDGAFHSLPPEASPRLIEQVTLDVERGQRSYQLLFDLDDTAMNLAGSPSYAMVFFEPETMLQHLDFWRLQIVSKFRNAQITDRLSRLNDTK